MSSEFKPEDFDAVNCRRTKNFAGSRHTLFTYPQGVKILVVRSSLPGGGVAVNFSALQALHDLEGPCFIRGINDYGDNDFFTAVEESPTKEPREGRNGAFVIFDPVDCEGEEYPPLPSGKRGSGDVPF